MNARLTLTPPAPDHRWTLAGLSYDGRFFVAGVPQGLKYSILL